MSSILKVDTIQDQSGNNIINENANTITIGASGDTITIPAGATLSNLGTATGFGLSWQSVQTTGFTAVKGNAYPCNTTSAAFTVTLPATPSAGDQVQVVDYAGTFDTNALTISPNGNKLEGATDNLQLTGDREGVILTYIDSTQGWIPTSGINEGTDALSPPFSGSIEYLVVAGGGGGGAHGGAGGGAGGFRTGTLTGLSVATNYTVTVGAGGGSTADDPGSQGSSSVFSTITSAGGGGGGGGIPSSAAGSGGSGGGGAGDASNPGGAGNTPSTSPSQGSSGGSGSMPGYSGGGGGGASAVGSNGSSGGGNGGNGTASSITGSSVTYAGGGGGSYQFSSPQGTGGTGGGGAGVVSVPANPGTANTGGGGGGNHQGSPNLAGLGGSGIVVLKYQSSFTITNPGGGLTFSTSTSGSNKITSFTAGTGNVQWNA